MHVFNVRSTLDSEIFCDLDAKECLMLYGMLVRSATRFMTMAATFENGVVQFVGAASECNSLADTVYSVCMNRVACLSISDAYIFQTPARSWWREQKTADAIAAKAGKLV